MVKLAPPAQKFDKFVDAKKQKFMHKPVYAAPKAPEKAPIKASYQMYQPKNADNLDLQHVGQAGYIEDTVLEEEIEDEQVGEPRTPQIVVDQVESG